MERSLKDLKDDLITIETHLANLKGLYLLINMAGIEYAGKTEDRESFEISKKFHADNISKEIGRLYMAFEVMESEIKNRMSWPIPDEKGDQ